MKKIIYSAFIALSLCACDSNKDESFNTTPEIPASPVVYHVSLPASFDAQTRAVTFDSDGQSITTQFEKGDRIYVYNQTKDAWARGADAGYKLSYLQPTNISGSTCTLVGDLSFYKKNDGDEWKLVTVAEGDEYSLYYQMNDPDCSESMARFYYELQEGSAETASQHDFAEAAGVTMTLTGNTLTAQNEISFQNLQSMFRQRLSFKKGSETVTPTIIKLTVGTNNGTLLLHYRPNYYGDSFGPFVTFDEFDIDYPVISADGDIYLSLAFYYTNDCPASGDQLILTAVDDEGNVYQCVKNVPTGGFEKSKYYHGSCELVWQYQIVKPTVSRSDGGDVDELEPGGDMYDIYAGSGDQIAITISGNSKNYWFWLNYDPAVVTLAGDGTATFDDNDPFIYADSDLTIELASDYTIICSGHQGAIWAESGYLKLKTTGSEQKLTVTTNSLTYSGIYGDTNYDRGTSESVDAVNALAADGFTVTCSDPVDNHDGTYTWVYTVSPN